MKHTPQNLPYHNLVGLEVEVLSHPDPGLKGLKGRVVDETKSFLVIEVGEKLVKVQKLSHFVFRLPNSKRVLVSGKAILGRPEDRLKRFLKARIK